MQKEKSIAGIKETAAKQIVKLLNKSVMIYQITENDTILHEVFHHNNTTVHDCDEIETNVHWVYQNNKTYQANNYYLPLASTNDIYGVVVIILEDVILDAFENNLVLSIVGE